MNYLLSSNGWIVRILASLIGIDSLLLYISQAADWGLLLPCAKFTLNSSCSASTGLSLAYTLYRRKPNLLLEMAVHSVTDSCVASISDCVAHISDIVQSIHKTLAQTAYSIVKQDNRKHHDFEVLCG